MFIYSLFSSFDISFYYFFSFSYIFIFLILFNFLFNLNYLNYFKNIFFLFMESFFKKMNDMKFKFIDFILMSLMLCIIIFNIFSIFCYNFSMTTQISFIFPLSLFYWTSVNIFYFFNNYKMMLCHYIPSDSPIYLSSFLFIVEIISNIIRPLTLMIRLLSNILAGHVLIILLSNFILIYNIFTPFLFILTMVEMFVGLIQSYIFVTLLYLYSSEIH